MAQNGRNLSTCCVRHMLFVHVDETLHTKKSSPVSLSVTNYLSINQRCHNSCIFCRWIREKSTEINKQGCIIRILQIRACRKAYLLTPMDHATLPHAKLTTLCCTPSIIKLAFHDAETDSDSPDTREEIACVGHKTVAVIGESVSVFGAVEQRSQTDRCRLLAHMCTVRFKFHLVDLLSTYYTPKFVTNRTDEA